MYKNYIQIAFWGLCIAFVNVPILGNTVQDLPKKQLFLNGQPVSLKSPLIREDKLIYIPLRDLTKNYGYRLTYSSKRQEYDFKISKYKKISFAMYWPKYTFKGQYHFWTGLPIRYKNRIYVPYKDAQIWFSNKLSLSAKNHTDALVTNHTPKDSKPAKAKLSTKNSKNIIWELKAKPIAKHYLPIPKLAKNENLTIIINNQKFNLSKEHLMKNGQLWLNFQPIFRKLGYTIHSKHNGYVVSKGKHKLFLTNSTQGLQFKKINSHWYSPLKETALYLGWVPYWRYQKIYFLNKIDTLQLQKTTKGLSLNIQSKFPLKHSQITQVDSKKLYIDLRHSYFDAQSHKGYPKNEYVDQITLGNHPLFNRLVINSQLASLANLNAQERILQIEFPKEQLSRKPKKHQKKKAKVVQTKPKPFRPFKKKTIAIDPGHGGIDPGAVLASQNKHEKHFVWDISTYLQTYLEKKGYKVVMLRKWDKNPSLWQRADQANKAKCDAIISVHLNSFTNPSARGSETYYYKYQDKILAQHMHQAIIDSLELRDNGIKKAKMYILNHSKMPGVLIEPAYLTNASNFEFIQSPKFRERLAKAIEKGLGSYFQSQR